MDYKLEVNSVYKNSLFNWLTLSKKSVFYFTVCFGCKLIIGLP